MKSEATGKGRITLTRTDWVMAARDKLESGGVTAVRIDRLARDLHVTRGSFYFHFADRDDLLTALLDDWQISNCLPFDSKLDNPDLDGRTIFDTINFEWFGAGTFRPYLDLAVRDWGKLSVSVAQKVAVADTNRIALLKRGLNDLGVVGDEAVIRARIAYFHQIGYFAVQFSEPLEQRLEYVPIYLKVLTGIEDWDVLHSVTELSRNLAATKKTKT